MAGWGPGAWAQLRSMGGAVLLALSLRCFCGEIFQIPSGSMIPTLAVGDRVLVNKLIYGPRLPFTPRRLWARRAPQRGEVVVFIAPLAPHDDYIKRIIAVAGDTVEVREGRVWVNQAPVPLKVGQTRVYRDRDGAGVWRDVLAVESCEQSPTAAYAVLADATFARDSHDHMPQRTVPDGHVFVMGDNRNHSSDSRDWGFVPQGAILGRATRFFFSWGEHGLSWRRIGRAVHHAPGDCPLPTAPRPFGG